MPFHRTDNKIWDNKNFTFITKVAQLYQLYGGWVVRCVAGVLEVASSNDPMGIILFFFCHTIFLILLCRCVCVCFYSFFGFIDDIHIDSFYRSLIRLWGSNGGGAFKTKPKITSSGRVKYHIRLMCLQPNYLKLHYLIHSYHVHIGHYAHTTDIKIYFHY